MAQSTSRRFIEQYGENETIDEVFVASEKQMRPNRNGNLYLQMTLSDRTGSVNAMLWNANDSTYNSFEVGDYVKVEGTTQFYNGNLQIIANAVFPAELGRINEEDFVQLTTEQAEELKKRLFAILREIENVHLRTLVECCMIDEEFVEKFSTAPAGIKNHHAYRGGLLEHVVQLVELAMAVASFYPGVDRDLLVVGAFLHDSGKIDELVYDKVMAYSDEGQMVGHVVMGVGILEQKIREAESLSGERFPKSLSNQLKHLIVSHHGKYEYGSPKLPMTLEALVLSYLDDMDAKLHHFEQVIQQDVNVDSNWTTYQPGIGRKIYRGEQ